MAKTNGWEASEVAQALLDARGFTSVAADKLGCTTQTIRNYIKRYRTVAQAKEEARERMKDKAEGMLLENIMSGNVAAQIFYLKTQAKDRGYTEKVEIEAGEDLTKLLMDLRGLNE